MKRIFIIESTVFLFTIISLLVIIAPPAAAIWTTDGEPLATLARAEVYQASYPQMTSDGAGGSIICWVDLRNGGQDLYAQRIDPDGQQLWVTNGLLVAGGPASYGKPLIVSDGAGGAILVYFDYGASDYYAQRLDADGNKLWGTGGVPVFPGIEVPEYPAIIPDGYGGMIVQWIDSRIGNDDIYAQRFSPGGVPRWASSGVPVCSQSSDQQGHQLVSDGAGGLIAGWRDLRYPDYGIYAQRVDSSGTRMWSANGLVVRSDTFGVHLPEMATDGSGGAIFAWTDYRGGDSSIYSARVNSAGSTPWTTNGVLICNASSYQDYVEIVSDGVGGAIMSWRDGRSIGDDQLYAQRIDDTGSPLWVANGVEICTPQIDYPRPILAADGAGGAIITWKDDIYGNSDYYCQRVDRNGLLRWTAGGVGVCTAQGDQKYLDVISDGSRGIILCWNDERAATSSGEVFAQRIDSEGDDLWISQGAPIAIKDYDLTPSDIVIDGEGGAIICWSDKRRDEYDLCAQRIDTLGNYLWTAEGVYVSRVVGAQRSAQMVADGYGGAVIAWADDRSGNWDIYAQRIDAGGDPVWTLDGIVVSNNPEEENGPRLVPDGAGGVIVVWCDRRSGNYDIYAQRISGAGSLMWTTGGVPVCVTGDDQWECYVVQDGSGGAVVAWTSGGYRDVYAQRINSSGTAQWASGGVAVCTVSYDKNTVDIAPDGSGGALLAWYDSRNGYDNVFVQKIDPGGSAAWTEDGLQVIDLYVADQYEPKVENDDNGGAIVVWEDRRGGGGLVYGQHVASNGNRVWHPDGRALCPGYTNQASPQMVSDGAGAVVVAWTDLRTTVDHDIYACRIGPSGDFEWLVPSGGIPVCSASGEQMNPVLASDGFRGAIIAWSDRRLSGDYKDIYAQQIRGAIGSVAPTSLDFGTVPVLNSQSRSFTVTNIGDLTLNEEIEITGQYYRIFNDPTEYTLAPGGDQLFNMSYEPEYAEINTCNIDLGSAALDDVFCTGTGQGPVCEIDAIDIVLPEPVMVGDSHDTTFTVTNAGGGILNGYISMTDDQFGLPAGDMPFSLYRYDTLEVTVRFEPTAEGTHQCVVETGSYLCTDVTVTAAAFLCPPDTVLYVDADAVGAQTGASWTDAFTDLQDALTRADACGSVTEIWVAAGTYYPTQTLDRYASFELRSNLGIYGGFAGTESLLGERDLSANTTILSGDIGIEGDEDDNSVRVVTGSDTDSTAVLDGLTVTGGNASRLDEAGGGMFINAGTPILRNVIFRENRAGAGGGGGLYCRNGSDARLYNCVFFKNVAADLGGGIFNSVSSPLIVNCTFSRNRADDSGAAIFNDNHSSPTLINVIMWGDETTSMWAPEIGNHGLSYPVISHSIVMDCGGSGPGWETSYGTDGGKNDDADPDFIDMIGGDLHLIAGSQAIDQGTQSVSWLPATDIDGLPRVQGSEIDMGAYEGGYEVVRVDMDTDPSLLDVTVDGETFVTPYTFYSRSGAVHEIGTSSPQLLSDIIYSFSGWSDAGSIVHQITLPVVGSIEFMASFSGACAYASIDSIVDVPGDQGGWVRVHFRRSHYDDLAETENPIERYDMHRRVDSPVLASAVLAEGKETEDGYIEYEGRLFVTLADAAGRTPEQVGPDGVPAAAPPGVWEVVGTVSASQQESYIGLAPTLADSSATIPYAVYYISAHSTTPAVYFDSPADSGYSIDNIAPGVPLGMMVAYNTGSGNELSWDDSPEEDFQYYRVYRGDEEGFTPGPGNLVHQTATSAWTDPDYDGWDVHYKITSFDHAGNESYAASPATTTGDDPHAAPKAFALYQNVPNPFNPATTIRFDLPKAGHVRLSVYNVKGELVSTLVDRQMTEGSKEIDWLATGAGGRPLSSGIYFYRLVAGDFVQTRKMVLLR